MKPPSADVWFPLAFQREREREGKRGNTTELAGRQKEAKKTKSRSKKRKSSERGFESQRVCSTAPRRKGNFRERGLEKHLKDLKDCEKSKTEGEQPTRY